MGHSQSDLSPAELSSAAEIEERRWSLAFAPYRGASRLRSSMELVATAAPFFLFWGGAMALLSLGLWWGVFLAIPAAAFLVRLFMIQHDCGHGSFFNRRQTNDWIGRLIGVLTLTPYEYWRRTHSVHHASAGNLDKRGMGDVVTLTVAEYRAMSRGQRLGYRLYRNPAIFLVLGSAVTFILKHRLPMGLMRSGARPWLSTMGTNAMILLIAGLLIWTVGLWPFLIVQLIVTMLAGVVGIWLFFVQHQFEDTYWETAEEWSFQNGALHGSSHYDLPPILRWFTANIGIHHVHHLASRIPFYRLGQVLRDFPELRDRGRLTLLKSFQAARLALWDENAKKLVSFRAARIAIA